LAMSAPFPSYVRTYSSAIYPRIYGYYAFIILVIDEDMNTNSLIKHLI